MTKKIWYRTTKFSENSEIESENSGNLSVTATSLAQIRKLQAYVGNPMEMHGSAYTHKKHATFCSFSTPLQFKHPNP